jgi:hypothetical protein
VGRKGKKEYKDLTVIEFTQGKGKKGPSLDADSVLAQMPT